MTDAVKNADIEDVLSSIRRLVSDDKRMPRDKLVLTEAQRVEPAASQAPAAEPAPSGPTTLLEVETLARQLLAQDDESAQDQILAQIRAALRNKALATQPDMPLVPDADGAEVAELAEDIPEVALETVPEPAPRLATVLTLGPRERVSAPDPVVVLDDAPDAAPVQEETAEEQAAEHVDTAPSDAITLDAMEDDSDAADTSTHRAALTLEQKIAELEALIGRDAPVFEPDEEDRGGNAAADLGGMAPMPWQGAETETAQPEDAEPELADDPAASVEAVTSELATSPQDAAPTEARPDTKPDTPPPGRHLHLAYDARQDDLIDMDQLQELVARLVRDELQGVLGERITRNVRKLVRREVQRALMDQDLD